MKTALFLIPVLIFTVSLLIRAEFLEKKRQIYFLKPVSTLIVILAALVSFLEPNHNSTYTFGVLLGLFFSLAGDIALMFQEKSKSFLVGLGFFLAAQVIYTFVFAILGQSSAWDILAGIALFIVAGMFYTLIRPNLGAMKGPVIGYIVIISMMVNRAFTAFASPVFSDIQAIMIAGGALLFYLSDMVLASNRFWRAWKYHRLSLVLYYSSQLLIALAASYFVQTNVSEMMEFL
jgi:uncharacterized membrane protein YhhN